MNLSKKLESAANVATIVLVVLVGWTLLRANFAPSPVAGANGQQPPAPKVGLNLNQTPLKDINWATNKNTLVLGLQTTCHFCTDSAPFFQKLALAASGNTKIVAVLPQTVDESKQYLSKLGVRVDEIRTAPLSSINVSGTPTIMLVNDKGVVKNVWVGKLQEEQQTQVLTAIAPPGGARQGGL